MPNFRRNLAVKVETPGGDNPLLLFFVSPKGTPPFYRGVPLSGVALKGKGGTPPYAYSIIAGSLPPGLSLNGISGDITGTPTTPGHYTFVARVQDFAANVFNKSFSIDIKSALFVVAGTPRPGEIPLPYSYQFIVADASGFRLTSGYSVVSGTIPAGLTFHSNGILDGTPTAPAGTSYFTVQATDGTDTIQFPVSVIIYEQLSIFVTEAFIGVDPSRLELPPVKRNIPYLAHATRTGGAPGGRFAFIQGDTSSGPADVPFGIKISSADGVISGKTDDPPTPRLSPLLLPVIGISFTDPLGGYIEDFFYLRVVNAASSTRISGSGFQNPVDNGGNISFVSGDASVTYSIDPNGAIDIRATGTGGGSGIQSINNIGPTSSGNFEIVGGTSIDVYEDSNGDLVIRYIGGGGGSGTVTSFSAGNLSPLFTTSVATATTTPALTFAQVNQNANLVFAGPTSGGAAAPTFRALTTSDVPAAVRRTLEFGTGSDGVVNFDGVAAITGFTRSGNQYLQTRDVWLASGSQLSGAAFIKTNGCRFICKGAFTNNSTAAIPFTPGGADGSTTPGTGGGGGGSASAAHTLGSGNPGATGGSGGAVNGSPGGAAGNVNAPRCGGGGGQGGKGGNAGANTGGAGGTAASSLTAYEPFESFAGGILYSVNASNVWTAIGGGGQGAGGGGGAGDGTAGGGGGGGGAPGGVMYIAIQNYVVGVGSTTTPFHVSGFNGGGGGVPAAGNRGGGGGGSGGGGGFCVFVYETVSQTITINASGGNGGNGGNATGTGIVGNGGGGGAGGVINTYCTATGVTQFAIGTFVGKPNAGAGVQAGVAGETTTLTCS